MSIFALENKGIKSMKKSLFLTLGLLMLASFANAQEYIEPTEKWKNAEVWGNNYHGWSFHQDWEVDFTVENQDGRFTPTDEEIAETEKLIQKRIAYLNRESHRREVSQRRFAYQRWLWSLLAR